MSDDANSAMLGEGDSVARRHNESQEGLPADTGEGDGAGISERFSPGAMPRDHNRPVHDAARLDSNVEAPSRGATSPDIEAGPEDDPQAPGKVE